MGGVLSCLEKHQEKKQNKMLDEYEELLRDYRYPLAGWDEEYIFNKI